MAPEKSGPSRRLAAGAISPLSFVGQASDLKQRRQLGRGRRRPVRIRNLDVDQLLERGIPPISGKIPRLVPCPVRNWSHRFCIMS